MGKNNFKPRSKFEAWVRGNGGTKAIAQALGVTQKGVQHWLCGYCKPRSKTCAKILKLARGKLTLKNIVSAGE